MGVEEKDTYAAEVENVKHDASSTPPQQLEDFDEKLAARIRHKIDLRLLPALGAMYAICLLDRNNLSNAAVAGMNVELKMEEGDNYNLVNMCFFITYITLQPFAVLLCRWMGPRWFLPMICVIWGSVIIGAGFSPNWQTLLGLRLILGALECGFFPGCLYLLSTWYTRFESSRRYSIFYLLGSCVGSLGGILAFGLQQLDGRGGLGGWRWIFIIEGVITGGIAIFALLYLVKFLDEELIRPSWKFLTRDELEFVAARLNADRGDVEVEPFTIKRFLEPATEWFIYGFPIILMLTTALGYAFAFTLPIILQSSLGFGVAEAQCLTAPPYFFSAILMYVAGWLSDKYRQRGLAIVILATIGLIGLPIMGWAKNPWVRYFGVFVSVGGANSTIPSVFAYQGTNIRGQWRRAFCSASLTGLGGIGGIIGALIFRQQDKPDYFPGFIACIVASVLIVITVGVMTIYFRRCNAECDRGERVLMGDPNFRFTI
ncbi:phthalate transporter [Eremomyces bilateralis CBS 781.70]|uniref:Phthalate transporter n=1 Tax=Eremomyces bilateralis CBS 781.70 TaxID=1392243 RepID=A0A6G1FW73_9PEZI|nr:phthalate transporter [Eremomyces bilateralis CBS 781.70]KAF1810087.1 phthalate transporter [Eremomyces bilateralis CBS 781.70]